MLRALCLVPGLFFGQVPQGPGSSALPALPRLAFDDGAGNKEETNAGALSVSTSLSPKEMQLTEKEKDFSVFSRPLWADRSSFSWITSAGPGRFNIIDWESRPNADRMWWLGRWPTSHEAQIYTHLGFNMHWWAGPVGNGTAPVPNLSPRLYDLYLDVTWAQRWTDRLTSEVRFRPGLYTDFRVTPPDAFRVPGQAITLFQACPELFLVGGIDHVQRNEIAVLPVAGFLWQPSPRWELRLTFPEPKIAFELSPREHLWGYIGGEYGGGRWTHEHESNRGERVEYSDFRLTFGIEWRDDYLSNLALLSTRSAAFLEMGYIFERRLRFSGPSPAFDPEPAWLIRLGRVW